MLIVSSGAALNVNGSPMSGGYAGAKKAQMFLAYSLQRAADARQLGIWFVALAPRQLLPGTAIGEAAAATYGSETGPLDPTGVARAILSIAFDDDHRDAAVLGVTHNGLEAIAG